MEAGPSSICMSCAGIGHDQLERCGDRRVKCVISMGAHKVESHQC